MLPTGQKSQMHADIQAVQRAWIQAALDHDAEAYDRLMTPEFFCVTLHGIVVAREAYLSALRVSDRTITKIELKEFFAALHGDTAVSNSVIDVKTLIAGLPFDGLMRMTAVWIKTDGAWKCACYHLSDIREQSAWEGLFKT